MAFPLFSFVNFPLSKIKNLMSQAQKTSIPKNIKAHRNTMSLVWMNKAKLKTQKGRIEKVEGRTGNGVGGQVTGNRNIVQASKA